MEHKRYMTERGVSIGVVPIPLLLDKISQAHAEIEAPTYTEHLAGGATQEVEITEAMAAVWAKENPDGWAEHADKWAAYQVLVKERSGQVNEALWLAVKLEAIIVHLPKGDAWIAKLARLGITVPDDPDERRMCYIETMVIGGKHDTMRILALATGAPITEEQLAEAEASF